MSNLKRYSLQNIAWGDGDCHTMEESVDGTFVKFDDIKELLNSPHNTGSPKLPIDYLEVENKLNAKSRTLFEYSNYEQGVKDCYKLL